MLNKKLRQARLISGLTQQNIADAIGVERSTYAFYETGTTTPPMKTLSKLAKLFNVSADFLMSEDDDDRLLLDSSMGGFSESKGPFLMFCCDDYSNLNKDIKVALSYLRVLDKEDRKQVLEYIKKIIDSPEYQKRNPEIY